MESFDRITPLLERPYNSSDFAFLSTQLAQRESEIPRGWQIADIFSAASLAAFCTAASVHTDFVDIAHNIPSIHLALTTSSLESSDRQTILSTGSFTDHPVRFIIPFQFQPLSTNAQEMNGIPASITFFLGDQSMVYTFFSEQQEEIGNLSKIDAFLGNFAHVIEATQPS